MDFTRRNLLGGVAFSALMPRELRPGQSGFASLASLPALPKDHPAYGWWNEELVPAEPMRQRVSNFPTIIRRDGLDIIEGPVGIYELA